MADALAVLDKYPFITDTQSPRNEIEQQRYTGSVIKIFPFTQELGRMFLQQDDTKTNAEKAALWGAFAQYNEGANYPNGSPIEPFLRGDEEGMRSYTREKINQLMEKARAKVGIPDQQRGMSPPP